MTRDEQIACLRVALRAARQELEWWVEGHACCAGKEVETMALIDATLASTEGADNENDPAPT